MTESPLTIESPFLRMLGARLDAWSEGFAQISLPTRPELLNRSGVIQGGVLATLLDHACGLAGMYCTVPGNRRYGMTLSLTINYAGQAKTGLVVATGRVTSSGKKIFFSAAEVRTDDGKLLATATGVLRYRTGSESPQGIPARASVD